LTTEALSSQKTCNTKLVANFLNFFQSLLICSNPVNREEVMLVGT
jgi:hypothetical protein